MMTTNATAPPFLQAARTSVKGYEHLHGFGICFRDNLIKQALKEPSRRPVIARREAVEGAY